MSSVGRHAGQRKLAPTALGATSPVLLFGTGPSLLRRERSPSWSENRPHFGRHIRRYMLLVLCNRAAKYDHAGSGQYEPNAPKSGAVNQGQAARRKAAAATETRLGDSDEASGRRSRSRPRHVQSSDITARQCALISCITLLLRSFEAYGTLPNAYRVAMGQKFSAGRFTNVTASSLHHGLPMTGSGRILGVRTADIPGGKSLTAILRHAM